MKANKGLFSAQNGQQTNTNNYAQLLIYAQEQKNLANKLLKVKSSVDNREPAKFNHLNNTRDKSGVYRQKQIDQENSLLLKRMLTIIKRKNSSYREGNPAQLNGGMSQQIPLSATTVSGVQGQGTTLNLAEQIMMPINGQRATAELPLNIHINQNHLQSNFIQGPQVISLHPLSGTMNYFQRKKEYENIQNQNMYLVRAIRDSKPALKREDWKEHIRQYERLKSQLNKKRPLTKSSTGMSQVGMLPSVMQQKSLSQASDRRLQSEINHRNLTGIQSGLVINESLNGRGINIGKTWGETQQNGRLLKEVQDQADGLVHQSSLNKSQDNIRHFNKQRIIQQNALSSSIDNTVNRIRRNTDNLRQNSHHVNRTGEGRRSSANPDTQHLLYQSPKKQTYFQNLLQSPLLNFSQFPQSILKRITTRVATADHPVRRRDVNQNFFPISQREEVNSQQQQYVFMNDQEAAAALYQQKLQETPDAAYQSIHQKSLEQHKEAS